MLGCCALKTEKKTNNSVTHRDGLLLFGGVGVAADEAVAVLAKAPRSHLRQRLALRNGQRGRLEKKQAQNKNDNEQPNSMQSQIQPLRNEDPFHSLLGLLLSTQRRCRDRRRGWRTCTWRSRSPGLPSCWSVAALLLTARHNWPTA